MSSVSPLTEEKSGTGSACHAWYRCMDGCLRLERDIIVIGCGVYLLIDNDGGGALGTSTHHSGL